MQLSTTRFGRLSVDEGSIITFPHGLLGFATHTRYTPVGVIRLGGLFWLQSVDDADLAFVVTEPFEFFRDFDVPLEPDVQAALELPDPAVAQVLAVCNIARGWLTANLLGPLVINPQNHLGRQVVLADRKWSARQPLLPLRTCLAQAA